MTDSQTPKRIQRKRTKGWRMPAGAVYVGRPSLWGNPWRSSDGFTYGVPPADRAAWAVRKYRAELEHWGLLSDYGWFVAPGKWDEIKARSEGCSNMAEFAMKELRGLDLVCWCPLEDADGSRVSCHADVLLELANPEVSFPWLK